MTFDADRRKADHLSGKKKKGTFTGDDDYKLAAVSDKLIESRAEYIEANDRVKQRIDGFYASRARFLDPHFCTVRRAPARTQTHPARR